MTKNEFQRQPGAKGNLLTWTGGTNTWDAQNRMLTVQRGTNSASFMYDGRNRCVRRTLNGVTTDYIYDGWNLIAEYQGATPLAEYIHGPGVDEVLARADATTTVYFCGDALNSTAALTDGTGAVVERYRYTAFGQPTVFDGSGGTLTASPYGNRFAFQGREWLSELNLTDHRNRYYSPELQRWPNRDPLGEPGFMLLTMGQQPTHTQDSDEDDEATTRHEQEKLNLYAFVHNDPIDQVDYLGLYGSSVDMAVRTCMALPSPAARTKCINDIFGSGDFTKCCVLAAVVRAAKAGVGALGGCKSGDSCAVLRAKSAAWITLAGARSRLNKVCFKGGDRTHQEETAKAWSNVGKCTKYQVNNGCTGPL